ncbi:PTS mannose/fructose/sorbose/N-acetylgalactosamine transporter subunit IIC [[Eubacterium] hominis]|uniref:PTS mannose/fructose/sorbose/N-acetylgalactosamine transporter subunit IIC n=1 Tax=[Eubacterium] hominis TaxID=2764325 RepID=UPI003A4DBF8C
MTIVQALMIAIVCWLIHGCEAWFAYPMINTPLVLCPVVGAILGDLNMGIVCGATLQLVFLGVMGIGGTLPADAALGSIVGTALAMTTGQDVEIALTFAVPVSLIGSTFTFIGYLIRTLFTPITHKFVESGNQRALTLEHVGLAFLPELPKYIVLFAVLAFGSGVAEDLIAIIPQTFIDGMDFATGLMPAVGIALLLKMMWNKSMAVYFFFGVVLACFFAQGTLSVALMGVIVAVIVISLEGNKEKQTVVESTVDDGGLFND